MTDSPKAANGQAAPGTEAPKAESELDKLLSEFDTAKPDKAAGAAPELVRTLKPVIDFAKEEMETRTRDAFLKDVDSAVTFLLEPEDLKSIPKRFGRGFLEAYATDNPSFRQAFIGRRSDPKAWQAALAQARAEFAEEAKLLPGNKVKTDIEAAKAAVAGEKATGEPPENEEAKIRGMTDGEFMAYRTKRLAQAKGY